MTESQLLDNIIGLCHELDLLVFHSADSRRDTGNGFPDLIIVGDHVVFAELKSYSGRLSREQSIWRYRLVAAGHGNQYHLWRPGDWTSGEIRQTLEETSR